MIWLELNRATAFVHKLSCVLRTISVETLEFLKGIFVRVGQIIPLVSDEFPLLFGRISK